MTTTTAQHFVARMRMDREFREAVKATADGRALRRLLRASGYAFSERELVGAMVGCMEEMGRQAAAGRG